MCENRNEKCKNWGRSFTRKTCEFFSFFAVLISLFVFSTALCAAGVEVTAKVDRNKMRPGDTFTYSISISSDGSTSFDKPTLPGLTDFEIINTWSGSEMRGTFVNGQMQVQRSQTFNYMMSAKKEGSFTIGAAEIVVNGQILRTNPIKIDVFASAPQAPSQTDANDDEESALPGFDNLEEDLFSQLLRRRVRPSPNGGQGPNTVADKDAFFIHVETDKNKIYQGEQLIVSWYLISKAQIADIDTLKYPTLTGFWKEDIEVATRLNFQPQIINGQHYQKALLASYALFPIKAGEAIIDAYQAKCRAIGVNAVGFPQEVVLTKSSDEVKIEVLPLPAADRPETFTGGVGQFTVAANIDVNSIKINTPITLKIRIEGKGNAKNIDMPKLDLPPEIQIYDTKSESKFYTNGRSFKEFETLLVPKSQGSFSIPAITLSFFDTNKKTYYTQSTTPIPFQVQASAGDEVISATKMKEAEKLEVEKKPELPEILLTVDVPAKYSTAQQLGGWGLLFSVTILAFTLFGFKEFRSQVERKDLRAHIESRMKKIEKKLAKSDWRGAGREATNLIYFSLGEISGQSGGSFEFEKLIEKAPPSFKREVAQRLREVMAKVEVVGFAPDDLARKWREKTELKKLMVDIEKLLIEATKYDFSSIEKDKSEA